MDDEPAPKDRRQQDPPPQHDRRVSPASADPVPRGPVASRLGLRAIDDTDARHRLDQLALSFELEEDNAIGSTCFGLRIRDEAFHKGFTLPRNTPKYNGAVKPEDWLIDYTTTIGIMGGNRRLAVRYAPLMLQGSASAWLNSLPAGSINAWVDFEQAFVRNFTDTYKRPGHPSQLAMCV